MQNIKLHEATKQFNITNKLAMFFLEKNGVPVKSHSSAVSMEQLEILREFSQNPDKIKNITKEFSKLSKKKKMPAKEADPVKTEKTEEKKPEEKPEEKIEEKKKSGEMKKETPPVVEEKKEVEKKKTEPETKAEVIHEKPAEKIEKKEPEPVKKEVPVEKPAPLLRHL